MSTHSNASSATNSSTSLFMNSPRIQAVLDQMSSNYIDAAIWVLRLMTLVFSFIYAFPIFGIPSTSSFQKALLSNGGANSFKIHQSINHLPHEQGIFTRLYFNENFHYLLYTLMFVSAEPHIVPLCPIVLYCLLHSAGYSLLILTKLNYEHSKLADLLRSIQGDNERDILLCIAYLEICLFPFVLILVYCGYSSIITLFMVFHFLNMRYMSQRNPFSREAFHNLHLLAEEMIIQNARCPDLLRNITRKVINFLTMMRPQIRDQ